MFVLEWHFPVPVLLEALFAAHHWHGKVPPEEHDFSDVVWQPARPFGANVSYVSVEAGTYSFDIFNRWQARGGRQPTGNSGFRRIENR